MHDKTPMEPTSGPGRLRRAWDWFWRPTQVVALGSLLTMGFAAGIVFWGGFNWSLELTNTEQFCISCHEMKSNVYEELKRTVHFQSRSGVRATCPDCHVPKEWQHKIVRKIQASNELYHHLLGSVSTKEKFDEKRIELAKHEWARMKSTDSRECRNCHKFDYMDYTLQEPRASKTHQTALTGGKTCIDCHRGIAHTLPPKADEAYKSVVESMEREKRKTLADYLSGALGRAEAEPAQAVK